MSKGSSARPLSIPKDEFDEKFRAIFDKQKPPVDELSNPDHGPDAEPLADVNQDERGAEQGGKPPYDRRRFER